MRWGVFLPPHTPLTIPWPFRPGIPRIFQAIRNCFQSLYATDPLVDAPERVGR